MTTKSPYSQVDKLSLQSTLIQIRERAQKIEKLSDLDLAPNEYFRQFLEEIVAAMAASGGAVWIRSSDGRLNLLAHAGKESKQILKKLNSWDHHDELLNNIITIPKSMVSLPVKSDPVQNNSNPTDKLLLIVPLCNSESCLGVVEIYQRSVNSLETQNGFLHFIEQMGRLASRYLSNRKLRDLEDKQTVWKIADEFSQCVHSSLDVKETSYGIANELCRLIYADRVTVTINQGPKNVVTAISNMAQFDSRSNAVRLLSKLGETVTESGQKLEYRGDLDSVDEKQKNILQHYLDHSEFRSITILPLFDYRTDKSQSKEDPEVIGSLIVERVDANYSDSEVESRLPVLQSHSELALSRALEHENQFLLPVIKTLSKVKAVKLLAKCPKWRIGTLFSITVMLVLAFYPANFTVISPGTLQPVIQRDIFASDNGIIDSLMVQNGENVQKGQVLATLKNSELDMEKENLEGELSAIRKSLSAAKINLFHNKKITPAEQDQLHAQVKQLKQTETSLLKKLGLFETKLEALIIRSPIAGKVVTWDVEKLLSQRPVTSGQRLMTIADQSNSWQVELNVKEDVLGYLQRAKSEQDSEIKVSFTMATHPGEIYEGVVKEIHNQTEQDKTGNQYVQVKVQVNSEGLPPLYTGAAIQGKLYCGKRSIGFVWFHDVIEFVQNKILFIL